MNFYTYVYRDPSRDMEPFYVGKGKGDRVKRHLYRTDMHPFVQRLQLMKKNGIEPDIEIIQAIDEGHAFFMESCLIEMFGRRDFKTGTLLNLTDGGEGGPSGRIFTDETRHKMSIANKGKKKSPESIAKTAAANRGRKHSPEAIAKISEFQKGKKKSPESVIKMSEAKKGKERSPEHCANLSKSHMGKKLSLETIAKMSAFNKGKVLSLEHKLKISESSKKRGISSETRAKMLETRRINKLNKVIL